MTTNPYTKRKQLVNGSSMYIKQSEQWQQGTPVKIWNEPCFDDVEPGSYPTDDGDTIVVGDGSIISEIINA